MSNLVDFLGLRILRGESLNKIKASPKLSQADVVEIVEERSDGFWRPQKVSWRKKIPPQPVIDQIPSKRTRKQIRGDEKKLTKKGIEVKAFDQLDQPLFGKWFKLYQKLIGEKEKGRMAIDDDWLEKKEAEGKKVGALLAFEKERLLGGNLFYKISDRLSVGYGAAQRISGLAGNLALMIDFYTMDYAQKAGYKKISFGQDTNFYGFHLSPGLIFYKAKLGFSPAPATKTFWVTTYFLSFEKFGDQIMFFGGQEESLQLYVLVESEKDKPEIYLPLDVTKSNILEKGEVLAKHRGVFQ